MSNLTASTDKERFFSGADKYAAYLQTPEGRLRLDLAWSNLQDFLPPSTQGLCALDLGCGTGAMAVRLAQLGIRVTLLDCSRPMLDLAGRAAREAGVTERIVLKHADVAQLQDLFQAGSFDIVLCHNVLEYFEDPTALLRGAARVMRGPSAMLSILVRNQAGEALKSALQEGDLEAAERNLTAEWGCESLYSGRVRLFSPQTLQPILAAASLVVTAQRGVRVLSDYLPARISRTGEYERIWALERKLGIRPEFAAIARYTQDLVRCADRVIGDGA